MKTQTLVSKISSAAVGLSITGLIFGCAPAGFTAVPSSSANKADEVPVVAQCVPDATDYLWDVNVFGFGLSGTDINIGYNGPVAGPITQVGVGAKINKGTLNLEMDVRKPYGIVHPITADYTQTSGFSFSLDLGIAKFGVGSNSDAQAAMIKLTSGSYQKLVSNAKSALSTDPNPWSSHIIRKPNSNQYVVPVGALAGMQYGDVFDVYKFEYEWADPSAGCSSGVVGGGKVSMKPVAQLIPVSIRDGEATLVLNAPTTTTIGVNDLIQVNSLFKATKSTKRADLKKSVRILGVHQPNHIAVAGVEIDLSSYLNYQMPALTNAGPYWIVP